MIDLANHGYNCVTVSLYDTLGPESVSYIIRHATVNIVFATAEKIPGLLRLKDSLPDLKVIVSIDKLGGEGKDSSKVKSLLDMWAKDKGVELYEFDEGEPPFTFSGWHAVWILTRNPSVACFRLSACLFDFHVMKLSDWVARTPLPSSPQLPRA